MVENIIFDLGGVLIDWNPKYVYRTIFNSEDEVDWFLENICTSDWNALQDKGRPLQEATQVLQNKYPQWSDQIAAYYGRWSEMLGGPIDQTVELLSKIKSNNRHNLYALTNWSQETFPVALERYEFLQWFQGIVVSGDEKCIKPDKDIYNILFERYHLDPASCLFFDDNKKNIATALQLGMQAWWFDTPEKLKEQLEETGII